jgi:enterochelin esterase family protein
MKFKILKSLLFTGILSCSISMAQEVGGVERLISPEISAQNDVTFRLRAPKATTVQLSGNWMPVVPNEDGLGGSRQLVTLIKDDQGVWSTTVKSMQPELYGYTFIVDDVTTIDPSNLKIARDGTFRNESILYVPGEAADLYWAKTGPKGGVHQLWYPSKSLKLTRRMLVYTPPGYENSNETYPVLYLLHGGGGDEEAWSTLGAAPHILDNLINKGAAKPMIVVMTNGNPSQAAANTLTPPIPETDLPVGGMGSMLFEKSLVADVIPYIESHFRVKNNKKNRAIAGLSMGGLQIINNSLNNPDLFDYYGIMSMGFADLSRFGIEIDTSKRAQQIEKLKASEPALYWIACGTDDFLFQSVVTMRSELDQHSFPYQYRESDGGHTWTNWRIYLSEFATKIFE